MRGEEPHPSGAPAIGVVTPVVHRGAPLTNQVAGLVASTVRPCCHVVVSMGHNDAGEALRAAGAERAGHPTQLIDLGVDDGGVPVGEARNIGAESAIGAGAELLVFLDGDLIPDPGMLAGFVRAADDRPDALLCGAVTFLPAPPPGGWSLRALPAMRASHPARPALPAGERRSTDHHHLFWSLSFAAAVTTWRAIGGFCERYRGYGADEVDFAMSARQAGVELVWAGDAHAYHQQHEVPSKAADHVDELLRNGAVFAERWGIWPMAPVFRRLEREGVVRADGQGGWIRT